MPLVNRPLNGDCSTRTYCVLVDGQRFVVGHSIGGMFRTCLQKDLQLDPTFVALPVMLQSPVFFLSGSS